MFTTKTTRHMKMPVFKLYLDKQSAATADQRWSASHATHSANTYVSNADQAESKARTKLEQTEKDTQAGADVGEGHRAKPSDLLVCS